MVDHRLHVHPRLGALAPRRAIAGVRVGERDDPAEVAPAALVAHEQRDVAWSLGAVTGARRRPRRRVEDVDLRAVDRPHPAVRRAICASSIEPETELWSVSASATWPSSPARCASSSGSETPSRNE